MLAHTALADPIVGCDAVACPVTKAGAYDTCTVTDNTFAGIGLLTINRLPDSLSGLSLVKGAGLAEPVRRKRNGPDAHGKSPVQRIYNSVYYLASPSTLDVSSVQGCIAVFHDTTDHQFPGIDRQSSSGECDDVIDDDCINALQGLISTEDTEQGYSLCEDLGNKLGNNIKECKDFAGTGRGVGRYTVTDLSEMSAITPAQNQSSNCWPVTDKTDSLSYIVNDQQEGNVTYDDTITELYKITPILTVLKSSSYGAKAYASTLSCNKIVTKAHMLRPEEASQGVIETRCSFAAAIIAWIGLLIRV